MGSYYDIDAILLDAEKVPCTFNLDLPGLGFHLDDNQTEDIPISTTHPLPLWLGTLLSVQRLSVPSSSSTNPPATSSKTILTLSLPSIISSPLHLNALKADPRVVDLRSWSRYYWGLVERCLELWDEEEVGEVAVASFLRRVEVVGERAQGRGREGGGGAEGQGWVDGLEEGERKLFKVAREESRAVREWLGEVPKRKG